MLYGDLICEEGDLLGWFGWFGWLLELGRVRGGILVLGSGRWVRLNERRILVMKGRLLGRVCGHRNNDIQVSLAFEFGGEVMQC